MKANRYRAVGLLLTLVLATTGIARAEDCVMPKVGAGSVKLRAQPSGTSDERGSLPAAGLPLVATLPGWYQAQLAGQPVYAAKHSTRIAKCAAGAVAASAATPAFELHAIDVGTGLAVLVRGSDFSLLYDAGSNDDTARGDGNRAIAYLDTLTPVVTSINHVILSHPHRDHVELLPDIVTRFKPKAVWNSGAFNNICGYRNFLFAIAADNGVEYHTQTFDPGVEPVQLNKKNCYGDEQPQQTLNLTHAKRIDNERIALGQSASMTFLYADGSPHASFNENSLVVRLDLGSRRVLLMGDAEAGGRATPDQAPANDSIEGKLLACCAAELKADVMVVGHHGSKTSSRKAFIDAVGAKLYIISAGPTKYATVVLPDAEIVSELEGVPGAQLFRTDLEDGSCLTSPDKVGPDNDGKPGGCDNVLVTLSVSGSISADYRRLSD